MDMKSILKLLAYIKQFVLTTLQESNAALSLLAYTALETAVNLLRYIQRLDWDSS